MGGGCSEQTLPWSHLGALPGPGTGSADTPQVTSAYIHFSDSPVSVNKHPARTSVFISAPDLRLLSIPAVKAWPAGA